MKKKHLSTDVKLNAIHAVRVLGQSAIQVSTTLCIDRRTIYNWLKKGKNAKKLSRKHNPLSGQQSKILGVNLKEILRIIKRPATEYGYDTSFWTTTRLIVILKKILKLKVSRMAVFRTLVAVNYSYKIPETRYYKPNLKKQKEWINKTVPEIMKVAKKYNAIQYFLDEANISLTPVSAKTWGPIGKKKIMIISGNRGSISVISAISSDGRLLFNVDGKSKRYKATDIVNFLSQMLAHHPKRHLVVIMDQAPCHTAKIVKAFIEKKKRLHLYYLPARSPEFNPDEKVWHYLKTHQLKSHGAKTIKELKVLVNKKLNKIKNNKKITLGIYKLSDGAFF